MKTYSKFLALFLAVIMTVASGTFMVSAAEGVTVTAGGVTLSDAATSTISLDQKSIDVAFSEAVDESALASNVSVLTDVQEEKILRLKKTTSGVEYASRITKQLATPISGGVLTVKFSAKYDGTRWPIVYVQGSNSTGGTVEVTSIGFHDQRYWYNSTDATGTFTDTKSRWVDVVCDVDFEQSKVFLDIDADGIIDWNGGVFKTAIDNFHTVSITGKDINNTMDIELKDVEMYHTAANGTKTTLVASDAISSTAVGSRPSAFTYGNTITTGASSCAVEAVTTGTAVTMSRSLSNDGKTYTLTNAGDWDPNKTYSLVVNGTKYDFKAKDLSAAVSAAAGSTALSEEETTTIPLTQKDITVSFAEAAGEASLADNVTLMSDRTEGKILRLKKTTSGVEYASRITKELATPISGGVLTVKFSAKYDGTRWPIVYVQGFDSSNALKEVTSFGFNGQTFWNNSTSSSGSFANTANRWVDVVCNVDFDNKNVKLDIDADGTIDGNFGFKTAIDQFHIVSITGKDINNTMDIELKDVEMYHTAANGTKTTLVASDAISSTAVGSRPSAFTYGNTITTGASSCAVETAVFGNEVAATRALSADGKTYTLTNEGNWDPAKTYTLTVGKGVKKADNVTAMSSTDKVYDFIARDLSGTVTVTAGDVTLSDVDANEIDLTEKTIDVAFSQAVQESTLAENVNLYTDVKTEKVLRITGELNSTYPYSDNIAFNLPSTITEGTVKVSYKTKISADTVRMPRIQFKDGSTLLAQAGYIDGKYWGNNSVSSVTAAYQGLGGQWVTVETVATVGEGSADNTYTTTFTKENGDVINANTHVRNVGSQVSGIAWYIQENAGKVDISMKDFVVTAVVNGNSTTYEMPLATATVGGSFPFGSFTENANGGVSFVVAEETSKTPVAVTRSLSGDGKTYSLTNDLGWNTSKNYLLELGTGILTTPGGLAVLDEAKSYSFVARNLGGVLTLDAITDTNGAALAEGGYLGASSKGVNLTFSEAVNTNTLSGITLEKKTTDRVLRTTLDANNGQYVTNWTEYAIPSGQTNGVYTFTTSVFVEDFEQVVTATGNKYTTPHIQWMDANGAVMSFIRPAVDRVEFSYENGTKASSDSSDGNKMPEATWVDIEYTLDLTNNKYSVKATDTKTGTTATWNGRDTVYKAAAVGKLQFGIYKHEQGTSGFEALWKNPKLTYTATNGEVTPLFDLNTDTATQAELISTFTNSIRSGYTGAWGLVDRENAPEIVAWTPAYNPTTKTVAIVPNAAFDYLTKYTLTVPTTVMSAEGAALYEGKTINFTAIYADGVYSAASGFKAGGSAINTIASDYTGDIKGWASLTNVSGSAKSAVVIVALYKDGKLVDIDPVPVNNIGAGATIPATEGTVTIDADKAGAGYTAAVYVWDSMDTMLPVSLKTTTK
ncbi:MAG: hypothetical protein II997_00525 [Clostridia bacterium]|nr:hypothetical protein [Clostridia bacterium]